MKLFRSTFLQIGLVVSLLLVSMTEKSSGQCNVSDSLNYFFRFQNPSGTGDFTNYLCQGIDSVGTISNHGFLDGSGYSVYLLAGTQVTFTADSCSGNAVSLTVVNDSNQIIPGAYAAPACPNTLQFTATSNGLYSVVMNLNGTCGGNGTTVIGQIYVQVTPGTTVPACPALANDTICGATELFLDSAFESGNTTDALPSDPMDTYLASIGADICSPLNNTLWFYFTPLIDIDTLNIIVTSGAGSGFHSWVVGMVADSVSDFCHSGLSFLGCVDGAADELGIDTVSIPLLGVFAGKAYIFLIDGYNGGSGPFSIALRTDPLVNNIEIKKESSFSIYPNPAGDFVHIKNISHENSDVEITLINVVGQAVFNKKINDLVEFKLDLHDQISGIYTLKITDKNGRIEKKLIISK